MERQRIRALPNEEKTEALDVLKQDLESEKQSPEYRKRKQEIIEARHAVETSEKSERVRSEPAEESTPEEHAGEKASIHTPSFNHRVQKHIVSQRIWGGEYEGPDGALNAHKRVFDTLIAQGRDVDAYSARSSLHYSVASNLIAQRRFSLIPQAVWYGLRAVLDSNATVSSAGGMHNLSAGQLDVRTSIMRRVGWRSEAVKCVEEALSRADMTDEARALLLVNRMRLLPARAENIQDLSEIVDQLLPQITSEEGPKPQAARIARACATVARAIQEKSHSNPVEFTRYREMARILDDHARAWAQESSRDQVVKINRPSRWRW